MTNYGAVSYAFFGQTGFHAVAEDIATYHDQPFTAADVGFLHEQLTASTIQRMLRSRMIREVSGKHGPQQYVRSESKLWRLIRVLSEAMDEQATPDDRPLPLSLPMSYFEWQWARHFYGGEGKYILASFERMCTLLWLLQRRYPYFTQHDIREIDSWVSISVVDHCQALSAAGMLESRHDPTDRNALWRRTDSPLWLGAFELRRIIADD